MIRMTRKTFFTLIEKIAYEQRRFANIENVIPDNYYEVIANLGIHVVVKDFKNDSYFWSFLLIVMIWVVTL